MPKCKRPRIRDEMEHVTALQVISESAPKAKQGEALAGGFYDDELNKRIIACVPSRLYVVTFS
jgi:hypothetical protein